MEQTKIIHPLLILVAGPYRSGTNDDPDLIKKNVSLMTEIALKIFEMGHLPVLGEWLALPLIEEAGSTHIGDETFIRIFNPLSVKLVRFCSAVIRVGGPSVGADEMVNVGIEYGKFIFHSLDEIPPLLHV